MTDVSGHPPHPCCGLAAGHRSRERAMTVAADGSWWCDPCIAPLVAALNDAGVRTVASCYGHGARPGSVALADGHELVLPVQDAAS